MAKLTEDQRKDVERALCWPPIWLISVTIGASIVTLVLAPWLTPILAVMAGCMAGERDASNRVRRALASLPQSSAPDRGEG